MATTWAFKQLISKSSEKAADHSTAERSLSVGNVIESGDFRINLADLTVTLRGQRLDLTTEEFDVLVFLAGHPQSLVTPRTMLSTNWTANRPHQTEFLRVLLSLREKLEAASPGSHYLRTEPWVIYRFDPASVAVS